MTHENTKPIKNYYVTTPIYYANARPHLGTLYSTVLADVASRIAMIMGKNVFFLTGTDEHGQKIAEVAEREGISPQELVDQNVRVFKNLWALYSINYSHFIRTTDEQHIRGVQEWIKRLIKKGDIYKGEYQGMYCVPCETFVLDREDSKKPVTCPSCGRPTVEVSEECYFFKLSAYQKKLLDFYKKYPSFVVPSERLHEVTAFVKGGLNDLCISRTTVTWGIPFPNDEEHKVYVWADALNNYITALGYGDPQREKDVPTWWPADLQVLGKDIVRFHAVYWPAFLMASGLELPDKLLVHGWIKVGEQKMSKSLGNVVDPFVLAELFGPDSVRYYLIRHMAITQDSPFNMSEVVARLNADLANDLGNLLNRMLALALKHNVAVVEPAKQLGTAELELRDQLWSMLEDFSLEMEEYYFNRAYGHVWKFIHAVNTYFHTQEPWKVAKTDLKRFSEIISATAHSLYAIGVLVWPVMPTKMEQLFKALGVSLPMGENVFEKLAVDPWHTRFTLAQIEPLFKRFEEPEMIETETSKKPHVTFDEFSKMELAVGTIIACEIPPESDRLYRLEIDFGDKGTWQIVSGIQAHFKPEDLLNRQCVAILNLKPRKIMGMESQGMILVAEKPDGTISLISPVDLVDNGTEVR